MDIYKEMTREEAHDKLDSVIDSLNDNPLTGLTVIAVSAHPHGDGYACHGTVCNTNIAPQDTMMAVCKQITDCLGERGFQKVLYSVMRDLFPSFRAQTEALKGLFPKLNGLEPESYGTAEAVDKHPQGKSTELPPQAPRRVA